MRGSFGSGVQNQKRFEVEDAYPIQRRYLLKGQVERAIVVRPTRKWERPGLASTKPSRFGESPDPPFV